MREHIETLVIGLSSALRRELRQEPRRRRPRTARSTYVPVMRENSRFAH
jgi:hypothetical protein